jgi:hypothetical protein
VSDAHPHEGEGTPARSPSEAPAADVPPRVVAKPMVPTPEIDPDATEPAPRARLDELLADPPDLPTMGALTGDREGRRVRRAIYLALLGGVVLAVLVGRWYARWLEEQSNKPPVPEYQLAEGAEDESRPDALVWTEGTARLGLSRQDPGVRAIVLPDRVLTLAPGCDHAQVKVRVEDGKTVALKVLVGEIQETNLRPEPAPP